MVAPKGHKPYNKNGEGGHQSPYTKEIIESYADKFLEWLKDPSHVWLKDFALDNDFDPDFLSVWAKKNERFGGAYRLAKARQESRLVNGGLLSTYNGSIVKLVLANAHGWTDKQQLSGDAVNPLSFIMQMADGGSKNLVPEDE